jgi:hypothetical protein
MNLGDMITEVDNIVDDSKFTSGMITDYINQAVQYAAAQVDLPGLKKLITAKTVVGQPYCSLAGVTGGFSGRLVRASDSGIAIYPNLQLLMDEYVSDDYLDLTQVGDVEAIALEGKTLWYQYVPAGITDIILLVYQNPSSLTANADIPSDFPDHVHRNLFVHGAAWMMFDMIEDGLEGSKPNTAAQFLLSFDESNRHSGITKVREWVGKSRKHWKSSVWSW